MLKGLLGVYRGECELIKQLYRAVFGLHFHNLSVPCCITPQGDQQLTKRESPEGIYPHSVGWMTWLGWGRSDHTLSVP